MKKYLLCVSFSAALLMACGEAKPVEEATEEVPTVDSVAVEMNKATEDIEKSSKELDELLNEI